MSATPYADAGPTYHAAGWSPIPLPAGRKWPPPVGWTGNGAPRPSGADVHEWASNGSGHANVGLRLPDDVVGIDVDDYGDKRGGETLAALEAALGVLPPTVRSSSRLEIDAVSGIRLYRVEPGRGWADPGAGIEVIHAGWRYAVVQPSVHPEGRGYLWVDDRTGVIGEIPAPAGLPVLPAAWVEHMQAGPGTLKANVGDVGVDAYLSALPDGETCPYLARLLAEFGPALLSGKERHGVLNDYVGKIVRGGDQGHHGAVGALATLHTAFSAVVDADPSRPRDEGEFKRSTTGAVGLVKATPTAEADKRCCGSDDDALKWQKLGADTTAVATNDTAAAAGKPNLNVTNTAVTADWLRISLGAGRLAGMFARSGEISYTPRVGEDGYEPIGDEHDHDGPAQVRRVDASVIASTIQYTFTCYKMTGDRPSPKPAMFPRPAAQVAVDVPHMLPNLRRLRGVTHTPVVRSDGTVLDVPGYDQVSGLLYLPEPGLSVPPVPDRPTAVDVKAAVELLDYATAGFPFVTAHDRVNFYAALLTPLLRQLIPPPYKLVAIGAPQPGSGKSLLGAFARILHGGVFRSETPEDDAELRKSITAILDVTTAPVVQFDNVTGVLRSSTLSGLLTSSRWDDRRLGSTAMVSRPNDRLWVVTGNNLVLGGDLVRRTLWVTIDPGVPHPEQRTGFAISNLEEWVRDRRGDLLHALLTLVRAWSVAGRPVGDERGSDGFAHWVRTVSGILAHASVDGTVDHPDSARQVVGSDDDEWAEFLAAVRAVYADTAWTVKELLGKVSTWQPIPADETWAAQQAAEHVRTHPIPLDALPAALVEKVTRARADATVVTKSLGMWLRNRDGRWAGGLTVRGRLDEHTKVKTWKVESAGSAGSAGSVSNPQRENSGENISYTGGNLAPQTPQTPQPSGLPGACGVCGRADIGALTDGLCTWCRAVAGAS